MKTTSQLFVIQRTQPEITCVSPSQQWFDSARAGADVYARGDADEIRSFAEKHTDGRGSVCGIALFTEHGSRNRGCGWYRGKSLRTDYAAVAEFFRVAANTPDSVKVVRRAAVETLTVGGSWVDGDSNWRYFTSAAVAARHCADGAEVKRVTGDNLAYALEFGRIGSGRRIKS